MQPRLVDTRRTASNAPARRSERGRDACVGRSSPRPLPRPRRPAASARPAGAPPASAAQAQPSGNGEEAASVSRGATAAALPRQASTSAVAALTLVEQPSSNGGGGGGGSGGGGEEEEQAVRRPPSVEDVLRRKAQRALDLLDETGVWTVLSAFLAFGTYLLETMNEEKFGGWDVLFRDDLSLAYGVSMSTIGYLEGVVNVLFVSEYVLRAWTARFSLSFLTSPFNLVDAASAAPPLLAFFGADPRVLRLLRVFRVLRLLRLLDRAPDSVLFGILRSDDTGLQLIGVAAEFVCIFCIAAGVIYDLELGSNPAVHNLSDALYWSFLTLTGIGQPFEIVTGPGKVATVLAVLVALVTIPGQLAKLATVSMASAQEKMRRPLTDLDAVAAAARERQAAAREGGGGGGGVGGDAAATAVISSQAAARQEARQAAAEAQQQSRGPPRLGVGAMRSAASSAFSGAVTGLASEAAAAAAARSQRSKARRLLITPCEGGCNARGRRHDADAAFCKWCGAPLGEEG